MLLRGNEEAHKRKIVTWKCVYYDVDLGRRSGWNFGAVSRFRLKDDLTKVVHVDGGCSIYPEPGREKGSIDAWRMIRKIKEGDLFEITGEFLGVEEFDYHTGIYIKPIKIKKIPE